MNEKSDAANAAKSNANTAPQTGSGSSEVGAPAAPRPAAQKPVKSASAPQRPVKESWTSILETWLFCAGVSSAIGWASCGLWLGAHWLWLHRLSVFRWSYFPAFAVVLVVVLSGLAESTKRRRLKGYSFAELCACGALSYFGAARLALKAGDPLEGTIGLLALVSAMFVGVRAFENFRKAKDAEPKSTAAAPQPVKPTPEPAPSSRLTSAPFVFVISSLGLFHPFLILDPFGRTAATAAMEFRSREFPGRTTRIDGVALDWAPTSEKTMSLDDARQYCERLEVDGRGWRMPLRAELGDAAKAYFHVINGDDERDPFMKYGRLPIWSTEGLYVEIHRGYATGWPWPDEQPPKKLSVRCVRSALPE